MVVSADRKKSELARSKRKQTALSLALISPYVIIFVLFTFVPVVMGIVFSFMKYNPYMGEENAFIGLANYLKVFDFSLPISKTFWKSFSTMLLFDIVAVPFLIVIPLALAYLINLHPPGYKLFRAILYLPSVVSITIVGIIFGNMFSSNSAGLINHLLGTEIKWLAGQPFEGDILRWLVILIASIWWQTGTNFVIFSGALQNVPRSLYEACEMDGGSRTTLLRVVTLPNIKSSVSICLFNTLIGYLNLYGQVAVLHAIDNAGTLVSPMMFIMKFLSSTAYAKQTGYICACTVVFGLFTLLVSLVQQKITAGRKRKYVYTSRCSAYLKGRAMFRSASSACTDGETEESEA